MYKVKFTPGARADLEALDPPIAQRILDKIRWLADNCDAIPHTPLSDPLRGYYKLRVGNYRALYKFDRRRKQIIVHLIGHRRQVYKRVV